MRLPEGVNESGGILFYIKEGYYHKFRIYKNKDIKNT